MRPSVDADTLCAAHRERLPARRRKSTTCGSSGQARNGADQRRFSRRDFSRCQSRSFEVARLSCSFLPLARPISQLGPAVLPVQFERHQRVALRSTAPISLFSSERLSSSLRVRIGSGTMCVEAVGSAEMCAPKRNASRVLDEDVGFLELRPAGAQALHLPALQRDAGFVRFLDEVLVARLAILRDHRIARGCGLVLLAHRGRGRCGSANCMPRRLHCSTMHTDAAMRMREVNRSALVPYTPAQMFALVEDIERYPRFLPWVDEAEADRAQRQRSRRPPRDGPRRHAREIHYAQRAQIRRTTWF